MLKFGEMTDTMTEWFKQNRHHLHYGNKEGFRVMACANSDTGYNWLYVNTMIYFRMFDDARYPTSEFTSDNGHFEFKIKIPN